MRTTAAFASTAGACAFVAAALAMPAAAKPGIHPNGPPLDGQNVALPDGRSARIVTEEFRDKSFNGPAPGGQQVAQPGAPMPARR